MDFERVLSGGLGEATKHSAENNGGQWHMSVFTDLLPVWQWCPLKLSLKNLKASWKFLGIIDNSCHANVPKGKVQLAISLHKLEGSMILA